MARRGCQGVIKFGASAIAEVRSISINESGTETDTSVLGNCATQSEVTSVTTTVDVEVFYKPDDTVQDAMLVGAKAALEIYPEGESSGMEYLTSSAAIVLSKTMAINHGDMISRTLSLKCNDGLTGATVS